MTTPIEIQASYGHPQLAPLVSIFEGNLDFDQVQVKRAEYAVKAFVPVEFVILATSTYLLEKFILAPLIDPVADKFNWAKAVKKYLEPSWPFRLTIRITEENLVIEANPDTAHDITGRVWSYLQQVLTILREENRLSGITKIQLIPEPNQSTVPLVICYEGNKPRYRVKVDQRKTIEIT